MADNPTIKTIKINNVDYDIKDAKARSDIAALIGSSDATSTIDTFNEVVDFLAGVTNTETLSGKLSTLETGKVSSVDWDSTNGKITYKKSSSGSAIDVVEVESSATSGSKKPISSGAMYTALSNKADKSATVSTVTYDTTNDKLTKTINGTTTDVVTAATIVSDGGGLTGVTFNGSSATITDGVAAITVTIPDGVTVDSTWVTNSTNPVQSKLVQSALADKADKSEMSVTAGTGTDADKTTIQLKSGTTATVLTTHQDISGKADKTATVSTVTYDSTSKKIQKTINGTTTDVVTLATVATSGSYNDLSNKPTIPTVPTNVSSFTNDSGYQTSANVNAALADVYDGYDSTSETISFTFPTTT